MKAKTDNALLLEHEDGETWIPLSQISDPDTYKVGDSDVTISITVWIAQQKGFDCD